MAKKSIVKKDEAKSIAEMQRDLVDYRRSHAAGELVNPRAITSLKKEIARAHTAKRLQEIKDLKENK